MNLALKTTWLLRNPVENGVFVKMLRSDFQVEFDQPTTSDMTFLDDFDAHLWDADHLLCRVGKQRFQLINGLDCIGEVRATAKARFWWDFPESEVKNKLKGLIGLRAILPVSSLKLIREDFSLRNCDEKIVVKGQLLQSAAGDDSSQYLTLQALRGYRKSFTQAKKLLRPLFDQEVQQFGLKTMLAEEKFKAAGKHESKPVHLSPNMPTELAVRVMAVEMIDQAIRHVDGVLADTDTVFLHQFRVSVRRVRSLISLLKKSMPLSTVEIVSPILSAMAGKTSELRDLDVFLLDKESYNAMLPAVYENGLKNLFERIEAQRQQEKSRISRYFLSSEFQQGIVACKAELSAAPAFQTPMSQRPVLSAAKSLLGKRYRTILAMSTRFTAQSNDEYVHDIRKELKKLRYLIEFFADLLPKKSTVRILSQLKKIQLILGQFNDYCVQIEFLSHYVDDRQIEMTKAVSGLIAILHHKKTETRKQVESALARFFTDDIAFEVGMAFGAKPAGESK